MLHGVIQQLNTSVQPQQLADFDEIILACGIQPRLPAIKGIEHPKVLTYLDVLRDKKPVGERVAIIGAGGLVLIPPSTSANPVIPAVWTALHSVVNGVSINIWYIVVDYLQQGPKCTHHHGRFSCCSGKPAKSVKVWVKLPVGSTALVWQCVG